MARIVDAAEREMAALCALASFRDKRVLDIGCGDGRTAARIARSAGFVLGVDPDPERIAVALAREPEPGACETRFAVEDAVTMELPEASLDAVVFTRSL